MVELWHNVTVSHSAIFYLQSATGFNDRNVLRCRTFTSFYVYEHLCNVLIRYKYGNMNYELWLKIKLRGSYW